MRCIADSALRIGCLRLFPLVGCFRSLAFALLQWCDACCVVFVPVGGTPAACFVVITEFLVSSSALPSMVVHCDGAADKMPLQLSPDAIRADLPFAKAARRGWGWCGCFGCVKRRLETMLFMMLSSSMAGGVAWRHACFRSSSLDDMFAVRQFSAVS